METKKLTRKEKKAEAAAKKSAEFKPYITETQVQHDFSRDEMVDLGKAISGKINSLQDLDNQLKSVKKDYAGRIEIVKTELNQINDKIACGFEMRTQRVLMFFKPKESTRFLFTETGDFVRTEEMMPGDFQMSLLPGLETGYKEGEALSKEMLAKVEKAMEPAAKE